MSTPEGTPEGTPERDLDGILSRFRWRVRILKPEDVAKVAHNTDRVFDEFAHSGIPVTRETVRAYALGVLGQYEQSRINTDLPVPSHLLPAFVMKAWLTSIAAIDAELEDAAIVVDDAAIDAELRNLLEEEG